MQTTITEALAEMKTLDKRLLTKRGFVEQYLMRQNVVRDPLEKEAGGSSGAIERELQAIADLEERKVRIRSAIQQSNATTFINVEGKDRTILDWLNWRKDVSATRRSFWARLSDLIAKHRKEAAQKGVAVTEKASAEFTTDLIVNVPERRPTNEVETIDTILGKLDGLLSLKNATTVIIVQD